MEFLKAKKNPKNRQSISLPNNITVDIIDPISNQNNENLREFLDFIFNNVSKEKLKTEKQLLNTSITRAVKTNIQINLSSWSNEELKAIKRKTIGAIFPIEMETNDDDNMNDFENIKKITKTKRDKKKKEVIEFGVASDTIDEHFEIFDKYRFYDDDDKRFRLRLHDSYVLNNKIGFLKSIQDKMMGLEYLVDNDTCDEQSKDTEPFQPLIHQMIVKQYLNSVSPYRGLLLYHGLGSGKTCSSIGIIESMKTNKEHIFVLTPASLQQNYKTQMKFCGNQLFQENNYWVYVPFPNDSSKDSFIKEIHILTRLSLKYLQRKRGIYLVDKQRDGESNFHTFDENQKVEIRDQINEMINNKFVFINYNGISREKWNVYFCKNGTINPFHNSTIIIDEGHNFVSRIFNKINIKKSSVSTDMYESIMSAENCNVVVLSGTPLINYPCELGVMFNIIGGYNFSYELRLTHKNNKMVNEKELVKILRKEMKSIDLINYFKEQNTLRITRNPYGFIRNKDGTIVYDMDEEKINAKDYEKKLIKVLKSPPYNYKIIDSNVILYKKFPDTEDEFNPIFISKNERSMKSKLEYFKNKTVGMVSYLGDKKSLMPQIVYKEDENTTEQKDDIFIERIPMNSYTLQKYSEARKLEVDIDKKQKKKAIMKNNDKFSSSYRIFSRSACNFVFPEDVKRPYPRMELSKMTEDDIENLSGEEMLTHNDGRYDESDVKSMETRAKKEYQREIDRILLHFQQNAHKYFDSDIPKYVRDESVQSGDKKSLQGLSPKIYRILQNLFDEENVGLHLLYSNFRKLGGIGILIDVLDYYGYTQFRVIKEKIGTYYEYKLDIRHPYYSDDEFKTNSMRERKFYALYTGNEGTEEKEIIRNIYNGNLDKIPKSLRQQIYTEFMAEDESELSNKFGDIINLLIISASGAEGIDLKNVRFVHIMEPYWHPVRISQVIGRARRICSHSQLPKEYQNVKIFMYLLCYDKLMINNIRDKYADLTQNDSNDAGKMLTTDEKLYEIMLNKKDLMEKFLTALKETSIDCLINYENKDKCLSFNYTMDQNKKTITDINYQNDKKDMIIKTGVRQNVQNNDVELNNDVDETDKQSFSQTKMTKKEYKPIPLYDENNPDSPSKLYAVEIHSEPMVAYDLQKYNNYKRLDKKGIVEIGSDKRYYLK
jgi:superfamily II DNA or RNA helicase